MQMLQQMVMVDFPQSGSGDKPPKNDLNSLAKELAKEFPRESFKHGFMHLMIEYQNAYDSGDIDNCMNLTMKFENYLARCGFQAYEFINSMCKNPEDLKSPFHWSNRYN